MTWLKRLVGKNLLKILTNILFTYLAHSFGFGQCKSKVFLQDMMWFRKSASATLRQDCFSESCVSALHCEEKGGKFVSRSAQNLDVLRSAQKVGCA